MKLGIIDLDTGNLASLTSAIEKLNINFKVCKTKYDFEQTDKLILPGVGAFKDFMDKLKKNSFDKIISEKIKKNIPILGVCVGFQVLFDKSNEFGNTKGLGILNGDIKNFKDISNEIKIPHVGWNECKIFKKSKLFDGINNNSDFYFTHSFTLSDCRVENILTKTSYQIEFISSVNFKNIYGVQFHPEKSQSNGLRLLKNFHDLC